MRPRLLGLCGALAALAVAPATAQSQSPPPLKFDRTVERSGSGVVLDLGPDELSLREESFGSIVVALPRGMPVDTESRKRLCRPEEATRAACPRTSRIGFGHIVVRFTGYLFPGGETHALAALVAYLGTPTQLGDVAALVLQVKPLGVRAIRQAVFDSFGIFLPLLRFSWIGRIVTVPAGPYGVELRFEGMPGGLGLPAPLAVRITRVKLAVGAVRRVRKTFFRRFRVPTLTGTKVRKVRDHFLLPHHLVRNPSHCTGSWPWELRVTFPDAVQRTPGRQPCKRGKIPVIPPRSPSPPQSS